MDEDQARTLYESLQRRKAIVQGLLERTRVQLEALLATVEGDANPDPKDIARIQLLTFQGKILVGVMGRLADEAAALALELQNTDEVARRVAPVIDPSEIEVPDYMPERL